MESGFHSLGQRASAMMLFLLKQDENDLFLIHQPEDDLDSQTVYEEVVKLLRTIKSKHQFIFATTMPISQYWVTPKLSQLVTLRITKSAFMRAASI